jgi:hypothetical protein
LKTNLISRPFAFLSRAANASCTTGHHQKLHSKPNTTHQHVTRCTFLMPENIHMSITASSASRSTELQARRGGMRYLHLGLRICRFGVQGGALVQKRHPLPFERVALLSQYCDLTHVTRRTPGLVTRTSRHT